MCGGGTVRSLILNVPVIYFTSLLLDSTSLSSAVITVTVITAGAERVRANLLDKQMPDPTSVI